MAGLVALALVWLPRQPLGLAVGFLVGFVGASYFAYLYGGGASKLVGRPWVPPLVGSGGQVVEEGSAFIVTQQGYAATAAVDEQTVRDLRDELKEGLIGAAVVGAASFLLL